MFIILTVSASYYRYIVLHDYIIEAQVACDPTIESCFVWSCDPSMEGDCTGDPEADIWHYKYAYRNAKYIPECNVEECDSFTCPSGGEPGCSEVICNEATLQQYGIEGLCVFRPNYDEIMIDYRSQQSEDN